MCGICGIKYLEGNPVDLAFYMLYCQQHRGQESFGIAATDGKKIVLTKHQGLVSTFSKKSYNQLIRNGNLLPIAAIGHNRYGNTGDDDIENYQPFVVQTKFGKIAFVHNGNIPEMSDISEEIHKNGFAPDGTTDSEMIAQLIAYYSYLPGISEIEDAIKLAVQRIQGAFSIIVMTQDKLIGLRDPWGIRPLSFAHLNGSGYIFASETSAIEAIDGEWICDVPSGEMIVVNYDGEIIRSKIFETTCEKMCIFEYIYFSAPASIIYDRSLKTARRHMGEELFYEHPVRAKDKADWIVGGVPDTGVPAAQGYAEASGLEYRDIFQRNRAIGRTFIDPDPRLRALGVKLKLLPYRRDIQGKHLVLVEDSIVRSNTMVQLIPILRRAGVASIHVRITSPPYMFVCQLGTDTQRPKELIAATKTVDEIRAHIGADSLGYLSLGGLVKAIDPLPGIGFCTGCFNQQYPFSTTK